MFKYNDDNFIFDVSWTSISTHSKFDELFKKTWIEKEEKNLFRYKYRSQNVVRLPGKYQFIKVLNIDRATKRRTPISFHKVLQPFDDSLFNFTKINREEYLFKLESPYNSCENSSDDILAINSSPLGDFHSLILPKISSKLPQSINNYSLHLSLQILLLSASPAMRIGYNSLCAYASVNHLHLHFYYLSYKMYLETCEVEYLSGSCYIIKDYPGKGFVFFLCSIDKILDLVRKVCILIDYLQSKNIPHNIYITRGLDINKCNLENETRNCIRIYIWARTPSGIKDVKCTSGTCELFGHLVLKNQEEFESFREENVIELLKNVTHTTYKSIKNDVKSLFLKN